MSSVKDKVTSMRGSRMLWLLTRPEGLVPFVAARLDLSTWGGESGNLESVIV